MRDKLPKHIKNKILQVSKYANKANKLAGEVEEYFNNNFNIDASTLYDCEEYKESFGFSDTWFSRMVNGEIIEKHLPALEKEFFEWLKEMRENNNERH